MRVTSGYEHRRARFEMVPLFDVVFLLLAFFISALATTTVCRGVTVVLPTAAGAAEPVDHFLILLEADGRIRVGNAPVTAEQAVAAAVARYRQSPCKVLIQGDRSAGLGAAVELLSRLRQAGVDAVSFLVSEAAP